MWTAIRFRPLQSVVLMLVAALVTACAAFTPLYDRAVSQAEASVRLAAAPVQSTGLQVTSNGQYPAGALSPESLTALVPATLRRYFRPPVDSTSVGLAKAPGSLSSPTGELVWREGMCAHLRFRSGRCPTRAGEVAVSAADSRNYGWRTGSTAEMIEQVTDPVAAKAAPAPHARLHVVGVYTVVPGDYWYGAAITGRSGTLSQGTRQPLFDDWLTPRSTLTGPAVDWLDPADEIDLRLDRVAVGVDDLLRLGPSVRRFVQQPQPADSSTDLMQPQRAVVTAYSGLPDLAEEVAHGRRQAGVVVPVLMVQLGLLSVVVLYLVLGAAVQQRRAEVAVARLRGHAVRGARSLLLRELCPAVLVGVPLGGLAAVVMSTLARRLLLPLDPPLELTTGFVAAVLGTAALLGLLTVLVAHQVAREPVAELLRAVPLRRAGAGVGVADAVVMAAAAVAVVTFASGGLRGPLALAAPALLALLVGLALAHLLVPLAAVAGRRLLGRGRLRTGVSLLQVSRRPATRSVVTVVTVATALLVFSADALAVGSRNREYAAEQANGAALSATVEGTDLAAVRAALRQVDPRGAHVTPVVTVRPPGEPETATVAVLPAAFARAALFPGDPRPAFPWERLAPPPVAPLRLVGSSVSMRIASTIGSRGAHDRAPVSLTLRLTGPDRLTTLVALADLPRGSVRAHVVHAAVHCAEGCELSGFALEPAPGQPASGTVTIGAVSSSRGATQPLAPARHWRDASEAAAGAIHSVRGGPDGSLTVRFHGTSTTPLLLTHASVPARLPALVAGALPPGSRPPLFEGLGLDGVSRPMVRAGRLQRVPGSPPNTQVVNLDVLQRDGATPDPLSQVQVWFARDDPGLLSRVRRALAARGVDVVETSTVTGRRRTFEETSVAWSLQLALLVGAAALLVAALVLVVVSAASWRSRSRDFAALRVSGVSPAVVSFIAVTEQVPVIGLAVVVGAVCGVCGSQLALPTVPLFAVPPLVSTLDLSTAWVAATAAAVLALVLLCTVGWAVGRWVVGRSAPQRAREAL